METFKNQIRVTVLTLKCRFLTVAAIHGVSHNELWICCAVVVELLQTVAGRQASEAYWTGVQQLDTIQHLALGGKVHTG